MSEAIGLPCLSASVDISARRDSKLEWWFIHGRFSGAEVHERCFMVSIFRFETPDANGHFIDAFSALVSVLDVRTGEQWTSSRVDRALLDALNEPGNARNLDPLSPQAIVDEFEAYGLPREFECPNELPVLSADPFRFVWSDLKLAADSEGLTLAFHEPGTGTRLRFELRLTSPPLTIDAAKAVGEPDEAMEYVAHPSMSLMGAAGGTAVEGEAWFDHQWGGYTWLQSKESPPQMRGWDWLGFELNDRSSWVVMRHWDARSQRELWRHVTRRDASGTVDMCHSFEWQPVRWWTSPATRIRHTIGWKLRVAEWNAQLEFEPFADNQEIRVFGPLRAIWEGAGVVRGSIAGCYVEGPARLEGQGRGYLFSFCEYLGSWAGLVDAELAAFLPRTFEERHVWRYAGAPEWAYDPFSYTEMLSRPLWDLLSRDGKRWRAVFSYLLLDALGRDPEPLRDFVFVLPELVHNASLIIDDIEDDSAIRRGDQAIHHRYGLDVAISAANTAYFLPMLAVLDHSILTSEEKQAACEAYQRQIVRAHLGQSLDLFWTRNLSEERLEAWIADSLEGKILQMYSLKTAAPLECLASVGLFLARADEATRRAVLAFVRSFGLAFQLIDDVNNFSDSPAWRKERGEDLKSGKLTYLILCALENSSHAESALLRKILCRPDLRRDPHFLKRGIELVMYSGACERVRKKARDLLVPAWEQTSHVIPPSISKMELRFLWEGLIGVSAEPRDGLHF